MPAFESINRGCASRPGKALTVLSFGVSLKGTSPWPVEQERRSV
jgi:hypothetical protein